MKIVYGKQKNAALSRLLGDLPLDLLKYFGVVYFFFDPDMRNKYLKWTLFILSQYATRIILIILLFQLLCNFTRTYETHAIALLFISMLFLKIKKVNKLNFLVLSLANSFLMILIFIKA